MSNKPHTDEITLGRMKASYECGNIRGKHDAEKHARIAALAAIRRAAEVARSIDRDIVEQSEWHDYELDSHGDDGWVPMTVVAEQIRRAIRAAIGSDKT